MFTKRIVGSTLACVGALTALSCAGSRASADDARLTVTPAVYRTAGDDNGATIQLVRHGWGGGYRGGWGGGYRGYGYGNRGWGGYGYRPIVRPYFGYGYGYPAYGYGYPAYGYYGGGYGYPAYGYGSGVGIGIW